MDGVSVASGVAGLITLALQVGDTVYAYVTALKDRAKNITELHSELLLLGEVLSHLRDFLNSEKAKGNGFDNDSVLQKAITDCKARIERIGDRLKPSQGGKMAQMMNRLKWPFEQSEVLQLMENLRRFRSTFEFAASIQGFRILSQTSNDASQSLKQLLELSKKTEEMYAQSGLVMETMAQESKRLEAVLYLLPILAASAVEVREVSQAIRLAEIREQEERTTKILDWLAPIETLHKHRDVQARRSRGTGEWFLRSTEFQNWIEDGTIHDLVCVGGPGVGKSVLLSLVIDKLKEQQKDKDTAVLYYYCDYSEQQAQTPSHLARSLLRQLCATCNSIPASVSEFFQKTRNEIKDQTWLQELQNVLRRVMATFSKCYIVIDAIDETEPIRQRAGLLEVVSHVRAGSGSVKVFATTRPHVTNLEEKLAQPATVQVSANLDDLRLHLSAMIDTHPDAADILDDELKREILDKLCDTANGMFLLPALHVRNILDQPTKGDVKDVLKHLSTDLAEVFSSTIDRIRNLSNSRKSVAFSALLWISHAARPLRVDELQHALAVRFDEPEINRDHFLSSRVILDSCCGLVEIDQDSNIIRLVHYTLEEYLQRQDHDLFEDAHHTILRTCLKYLSMESLRALPFKNRSDFEQAMQDSAFLDYSCLQWGRHAKYVQVEQYQDLAVPLFSKSQSLLLMARIKDAKTPDFGKWKERMWAWAYSRHGGASISLGCSFGLTDLVRLLLSQHRTPNLAARNMYGSTPLHECAILGFEDTAELLIAHGADVLDQNKGRATPFFLAVSYGRLSMAKTLLKYNRAQLNSHCKNGFTPLQKATDLGSEPLVQWLLQEGALVNARNDKGRMALHVAALHGFTAIAQMLVLRGASLSSTADHRQTPLDLAATAGNAQTVNYLIENGSDVQQSDEGGWTPLHRAARGGHVDSVVLLLENGAEIINTDAKSNLPLHHAARAGHLETVIQLLEYDASVKKKQLFFRNGKGSNGDTPRGVAFYCAHYDVHKYLRAQEWDVLGVEPTSSSRMSMAIESGDLKLAEEHLNDDQTLLETADEDGQPPLHVAIQEAQLAIAQMLLARGANIEASGFHGWHALHIAASLGNLEMVNLMLANGANIQSRTSTYQTPLHKAASSRSLPTLKRLLDAGADLTAVNDRRMNVLHIAAHQNDINIVRYLVLDCKMDLLVRDRYGQTPWMWAERSAHLEVLSFLKVEERKIKKARGEHVTLKEVDGRKDKIMPGASTESLASGDLEEDIDEDEGRATSLVF